MSVGEKEVAFKKRRKGVDRSSKLFLVRVRLIKVLSGAENKLLLGRERKKERERDRERERERESRLLHGSTFACLVWYFSYELD